MPSGAPFSSVLRKSSSMGSTKLIAGSDVKAERGFEFWLKCEHLVCVTPLADGSCSAPALRSVLEGPQRSGDESSSSLLGDTRCRDRGSAGQAEDSSTLCRKILTSAVISNICLSSRSDPLLDVAIGEELAAGFPEV